MNRMSNLDTQIRGSSSPPSLTLRTVPDVRAPQPSAPTQPEEERPRKKARQYDRAEGENIKRHLSDVPANQKETNL